MTSPRSGPAGIGRDGRSDAELLASAGADPRAFRMFYARNVKALLTFFWSRTLDPDLASDLTAETFAAALANLERFDPAKGSPQQWLYGIANNQLKRMWRWNRVSSAARRRLQVQTPPTAAAGWEEIEAADARRRIQARGSRRRNRVLLTATAAIAVLAVAALVLASLRAQPVAAHLFRIVYLDEEIHLEIVDLVEDPHAAERHLQDELGIDVELVALPAPPELVDQVVGAAGTGTTAAVVIFDDAGRSERVVLPRRVDGTLTIHYGREARPGERYHVNITSPACRELWATTLRQAAARLAELADRIRYDTIDPDYRLIDIMFLADDEALVVFSAHLDALGTDRPNCGWPTDPAG